MATAGPHCGYTKAQTELLGCHGRVKFSKNSHHFLWLLTAHIMASSLVENEEDSKGDIVGQDQVKKDGNAVSNTMDPAKGGWSGKKPLHSRCAKTTIWRGPE